MLGGVMTLLHWVVTIFYLYVIYYLISYGLDYGFISIAKDLSDPAVLFTVMSPLITFCLTDWIVSGKVTVSVLNRK